MDRSGDAFGEGTVHANAGDGHVQGFGFDVEDISLKIIAERARGTGCE